MGHRIYQFNKTGGIWGSTPGSTYNFIEINESMTNVAIVVTPVYDVVADQSLTFYIGSTFEMYDGLISESMPRFMISLLIIIIGVFLFFYYQFMHTKQNLSKEIRYLSFFTIMAGVWSLNETDVTTLIVIDKAFNSLIPYFTLMLVVPAFVLFFDSYLNFTNKIFKRIMLIASMIEVVTCTILHLTKIAEFRETLWVMQLMLIIAAIYMFAGVLSQIIRRKITRQTQICAIGLTLFLVAVLVDIRQYYIALGDTDRIGRFAFLIFVILLSWDMIKDANEIIEKGRRAKQLEIFALTDSMTGLFNRNAFESHAETESELKGLIAVVADANGLKACNDTYGHEAGDEYITTVAEIFSSVFSKYGNCYRTGGDEFCCIIPNGNQVNVDRLKRLVMTKIYTANMDGEHRFSLGMAIGSAKYDASIDTDFRAIVKRADSDMYENKKKFKQSV